MNRHGRDGIAVVLGAGPAGLTAAYELVSRSGIKPIVLEKSQYMGGLSRTVTHNGNRIDIGGHRFFSKSDRVMAWWLDKLPLQRTSSGATLAYRGRSSGIGPQDDGPDPELTDRVMLLRPRRSSILHRGQLFSYPLSLGPETIAKLGVARTAKIGASYLRSALHPIRNERTLEDFLINRFGRELYRTFFKSYTEKVWGVSCERIPAQWGAQRIKGVSAWRAIAHSARKLMRAGTRNLDDKRQETSLIEQFLYPKYGPGQMWEEVARRIVEKGGEIHTGQNFERLLTGEGRVTGVETRGTGAEPRRWEGDYFFSTVPVRELIRSFDKPPPANVREVADGLCYRNFITVGVLLKSLRLGRGAGALRDNWVYVQEDGVLVGRLQFFNNWSPYMVSDSSQVWLGMEYFCDQDGSLWTMPDDALSQMAVSELEKLGIAQASDALDTTVIRIEAAYPAYWGTYDRLSEIRAFVDEFANLFLIGRNGMHRYNNQDHSMLTAMIGVDNILAGVTGKAALWEVNTEEDYHEERSEAPGR